ncbi:hypothetical protein C8F04DRAFT_1195838 [Mycena alexandri]|uniref:Uncharacterized protein n=1 Tax=Mycena alexandri TaxID=1745969 RepID=A0AAD6WRM5_9AGAR|nr:hypothetical protein C8F04DRAFT_1195838 [Mycena alexandri]
MSAVNPEGELVTCQEFSTESLCGCVVQWLLYYDACAPSQGASAASAWASSAVDEAGQLDSGLPVQAAQLEAVHVPHGTSSSLETGCSQPLTLAEGVPQEPKTCDPRAVPFAAGPVDQAWASATISAAAEKPCNQCNYNMGRRTLPGVKPRSSARVRKNWQREEWNVPREGKTLSLRTSSAANKKKTFAGDAHTVTAGHGGGEGQELKRWIRDRRD